MNSPSRRSCRYRQPPTTGLVSRKQPSPKNTDAQSTGGASRWSIRSTSTWATIKKHRFSGVKRDKQPSASSFAAAVKHQAGKDDDIASTATINAMEPLLGVTESRPIKKMMRSSPFTYKTGSSSTSLLSFKIGKGRMAASLTREASIQERCRRWKPMSSKKPVRIPSNVVLRMTKQTFSYDSFSSSRGSPSPPPQHVESPAAANSVELNSTIFVEYTFDFDENFIGDLTVPNHFRSLDATEHEVDPKSNLVTEEQSTESSKSNPSPRNLHPRHPPEQHFIPPFNPNPTLDETVDDGADDRDLEHVLSASDSNGLSRHCNRRPCPENTTSSGEDLSFDLFLPNMQGTPQESRDNSDDVSILPTDGFDELELDPATEDYIHTKGSPLSRGKESITSSAIAWSALAALLGTHSPSSPFQEKKGRVVKNLWADAVLNGDNIISLAASEGFDVDDDASMPSLDVQSHDIF